MPLDMPQSLCALDHAGTGKEGSSAERKRDRLVVEKLGKQETLPDWSTGDENRHKAEASLAGFPSV